MNHNLIPWTVEIRALRTQLGAPRGGAAQAVSVDVTVRALTPAVPASIAECMDYQPICRWLLEQLPARQHALCRESALRALLDFVFDADSRVESVCAAMSAPGADALTISRSRLEHEDASSQADVAGGPVAAVLDV